MNQIKLLEKQKSTHSKGTSISKRQQNVINILWAIYKNNVQVYRKKVCCYVSVYLLWINMWFSEVWQTKATFRHVNCLLFNADLMQSTCDQITHPLWLIWNLLHTVTLKAYASQENRSALPDLSIYYMYCSSFLFLFWNNGNLIEIRWRHLSENWILKSGQHNLELLLGTKCALCIAHFCFLIFSFYFFMSCPCHQKTPFTVNYSEEFFFWSWKHNSF